MCFYDCTCVETKTWTKKLSPYRRKHVWSTMLYSFDLRCFVGEVDKSHAMAVSSARKTTGCPWSLVRRPQESPDPNRQSAPMPVQNGVEQAHLWPSCVATYYSRYVLLRVCTHWFTLPFMECTCIRVRSGTAQLVPITVAVCAGWESANSVFIRVFTR